MKRHDQRGALPRRTLLLGGIAVVGGGALLGTSQAWAGVDEPRIIPCAEWGARPARPGVIVYPEPPVKIIVHHTATPNTSRTSVEDAKSLARGIQNFHMDERGWPDTGQHFTISRGGHMLEGRWGSLDALRDGTRHVEGAHCRGQNRVSVGIECEGTYIDVRPPRKLWDELRTLCAYTCQQYSIAPHEIYGHRDFGDTACPGDVFYKMLPRLRTEVAALLGKGLVESEIHKLTWPLLRVEDRGPAVKAAQHLLRDAGLTSVEPTGHFDARTEEAVRAFQASRQTEEVNGMIGGESWPLLARPVQPGETSEAALAVRILTEVHTPALEWSGVVDHRRWQELLAGAGLTR